MLFYVAYFIQFYNVEQVFSVFSLPGCTYHDNDPVILFNNSIEAMHRFGMIDIMLLPIAIILIKSKQDILQGVSKLDDLLKCSVF